MGGLERPSGGLERPSGGPMILSGLYGFRSDSSTLRKDPNDSKECFMILKDYWSGLERPSGGRAPIGRSPYL